MEQSLKRKAAYSPEGILINDGAFRLQGGMSGTQDAGEQRHGADFHFSLG
ncbi:hypothetical protein HHJ06_10025 [Akkermansia muciniphila]|nr:hypothetical protein [Akkermansia muciniphila]